MTSQRRRAERPSRRRFGSSRSLLTALVLALCLVSHLFAQDGGATDTGRTTAAAAADRATAISEPTLDFSIVAERGAEADADVAVAKRKLSDQLESMGIRGVLDDITVTLGGSVGGSAVRPLSSSGSASLTGRIDLLPQLSLSGDVSAFASGDPEPWSGPASLSAGLSLTFTPFAGTTSRDRDQITAEQLRIDLEEAVKNAGYAAVEALIDAVSAHLDLDLRRTQQDIAQRTLTNVTALHDRDRATDEELSAAKDAVRNGEQQVVRAQLAVERAMQTLARAIGSPSASLTLPGADELGLAGLVSRAQETAQTLTASELATDALDVRRAELEVESAQLVVGSTHRFTPELLVTASGGLPDWEYGVQAKLTVSPSDWDGLAVADAQDDLTQTEDDYEFAVKIAILDAQSALDELRFSLANLQAARDDLSTARQDMVEADFRFSRGELTTLERDRVQLRVTEADHDVVAAQLDVVERLMLVTYQLY